MSEDNEAETAFELEIQKYGFQWVESLKWRKQKHSHEHKWPGKGAGSKKINGMIRK